MKIFNNAHLTGTVLAAVACASLIGCNRNADREVMNDRSVTSTTQSSSGYTTQDTASNTTIAADDSAASSAAAASHARVHARPALTTEDDSYFYDSELATKDSGMIDPSQNAGAVDATHDFDSVSGSVSGTTQAPMTYREDGLSPFAQEPFSRIPATVGSGQLTGEDKSTTILDGPSLFQDPSALGRDLIK